MDVYGQWRPIEGGAVGREWRTIEGGAVRGEWRTIEGGAVRAEWWYVYYSFCILWPALFVSLDCQLFIVHSGFFLTVIILLDV